MPAPLNQLGALGALGFDAAIRSHAAHRHAEPAFIDASGTSTWGQFEQRVEALSELLLARGVQRGDCIALLVGNTRWAYEVMFAVARVGGVFTPLSALLPANLLAKLMQDSGARLLFSGEGYESLSAAAALQMSKPLSVIEQQAVTDPIGRRMDSARIAEAGSDDPMTIVYSSGTTGVPKGILHTHGSRLGLAWQFGMALGVTPRTRSLLTTPPSSNGTMILLLPTLYAGGTCILARTFSAPEFISLVASHDVTHAFAVPTQLKGLMQVAGDDGSVFKGMRCVVSSGAPMPADVKAWLLRHAEHCLHEVWGFSEGVATGIYPGEFARMPHSVGRALPGTQIKLIDEQGRETLHGPGEIVGRSIMMMREYFNRPDANEAIAWRDVDGALFYRTGDLGEVDAQGYLTLRGRIKEMIISGGLNVYPIDLEGVLREHSDIDDAAVVGVPHEKWGEVPVAFVIARPGRQIRAPEVMSWCNERVGKHQRLADLIVRTQDFPRNALGKVLKTELRANYVTQGECLSI